MNCDGFGICKYCLQLNDFIVFVCLNYNKLLECNSVIICIFSLVGFVQHLHLYL